MARKRSEEGLKRYIEERNGIKYVYDSTSKMEDGKKVTVSTYLGKLDPISGELIPKKKRNNKAEREDIRKEMIAPPGKMRSKAYGNVHFLNRLQDRMNIRNDLISSFGPFGDEVLTLAFSQAIQPGAFSNTEAILDNNAVREILDVKTSLSSPRVSEITKLIGESDICMNHFFDLRLEKCGDVLAWDTTTNGTYTDRTGMAEWVSKNKDDEKLKQVKVGLATDSRGIPVLTELFPGSLSDVVLTRRFAHSLKQRGKDLLFVADNGFESAGNVLFLIDEGIRFVMPADTTCKAIKTMMTNFWNSKAKDRVFDGHSYRVEETHLVIVPDGKRLTASGDRAYTYLCEHDDQFSLSEKKVKAFVCYDSKKYSDGEQRLKLWLDSIEKQLDGRTFKNPQREFDNVAKDGAKYFDVSYDNGTIHLKRRQNAISFSDNRAGMFVMLASPEISWEQMMAAYDARRLTEQAFDAQKNGLDGRRFRTGDIRSAKGRFFVKMIALMLTCEISAQIREKKMRTTSDLVLLSTGNISVVSYGTARGLTEITKTNRELFENFSMPQPDIGNITHI